MSSKRVQVSMSLESKEKLDQLAKTLNISRSAVISQAVARMYLSERDLIKKKRRGRGRRTAPQIDQAVKGLTGGS